MDMLALKEIIADEIKSHFGEQDCESVGKFKYKFTCICGDVVFIDEQTTTISTYDNAIAEHIAEVIVGIVKEQSNDN